MTTQTWSNKRFYKKILSAPTGLVWDTRKYAISDFSREIAQKMEQNLEATLDWTIQSRMARFIRTINL